MCVRERRKQRLFLGRDWRPEGRAIVLVGGWFFCNRHYCVHVLIKTKQFSEDLVTSFLF